MTDTTTRTSIPTTVELLKDQPQNWGRWGHDDEVGALNYLGPAEALAGAAEITSGKSFTLQVQIGNPKGDPAFPGARGPAERENVMDRGVYLAGEGPEADGGAQFADDKITMYLQGSSQYDALGHLWCGDQIYNGYAAETTTGGMKKASILPIAEKGIVGRGILIDIARHRGKKSLAKGETFDHKDLLAAAASQGVDIRKRDILLIHTGWLEYFYETPREEFYANFNEPGLTYSPELVAWFNEMEIPNLVTDTLANEVTTDPVSGVWLPLHNALMRNLGVTFAEIIALDALAADCAADGQYTFFYTAAPLKVVEGTGAPVNPVVVK
ncbi:metal-dependent hydrolase [Rhodococcus sp. 06-462-5]|uniref:cyclase family protein n=1 Tax=unclassified Rhodococcus (in: high G+C Gram-positive bacteria) TaxID=192944 RepID=UPI000B9C314C|nr:MULTISPECIES: cyclase family protein [unclassified Rhodococcus (in: high G+C Gram-positive bacteria)]OZC73624.1 metal-dependent hydrolase [Rhodococcus sp. 06-462-5]OZE63433.1 metal-dependent hydrolase [Rhodococcus sp. 02-925g]